jgi:ankyrin repeat protein
LIEMARALLKAGADPNAKVQREEGGGRGGRRESPFAHPSQTVEGYTPLHFAVLNQRSSIVKLLLVRFFFRSFFKNKISFFFRNFGFLFLGSLRRFSNFLPLLGIWCRSQREMQRRKYSRGKSLSRFL